MKQTLKQRLVKYLSACYPVYVASGTIQKKVAEEGKYTPRTAVRRLEEMVEDNLLEVDYRKGHSYYRIKKEHKIEKPIHYVRHPLTGELITIEEYARL